MAVKVIFSGSAKNICHLIKVVTLRIVFLEKFNSSSFFFVIFALITS
ncbi:MAG: hypothetical protein LRZ98_00155 [Candidatus Pacebacteria bacterium]|nr:hypothetical protein [Candidatus Paceibacterota bacterium]